MIEILLNDLTPAELESAPAGFQTLCRITTPDEAIALCERLGGLELFIPVPDSATTHLTEVRGELRDILSEPSYDRLLREWGGDKFLFPRLNNLKRKRRDRLIRARIDLACKDGESIEKAIKEVVRTHGMHRRNVYRILKQVD